MFQPHAGEYLTHGHKIVSSENKTSRDKGAAGGLLRIARWEEGSLAHQWFPQQPVPGPALLGSGLAL